MPELPEVETIRRDLEKSILHKTIQNVKVCDSFVLRTPEKEFIKQLKNQFITDVSRKGKALIFCLKKVNATSYLVIQLMMTGQLVFKGHINRHTRVVFYLTAENGRDRSLLLYNDQRRFGQLRVIHDFSELKYLNILGPEPLSASLKPEYIFEKTRNKNRPIKNLLLDHTFVAGLGNIYVCEILFRCGINPAKAAGQLNLKNAKDICKHTVEVLNQAILHRGSSFRNYTDASGEKGAFISLLKVYGRQGKECLVCSRPIKRIIQAGRSTFYCERCQK